MHHARVKTKSVISTPSYVSADWVCASGLRYYFTRDPLDFRFRPLEQGYSRASPQGIDQRNPTSIICSSPWKKIHG